MINTENPISRDMILRSTYKLKEYNQVVYTNLELKSADKKKQKECLKTRGELIDEKNNNLNKKDIRFKIFCVGINDNRNWVSFDESSLGKPNKKKRMEKWDIIVTTDIAHIQYSKYPKNKSSHKICWKFEFIWLRHCMHNRALANIRHSKQRTFLTNYQVYQSDRPLSMDNKTKQGRLFIAINNEIPHELIQIDLNYQDYTTIKLSIKKYWYAASIMPRFLAIINGMLQTLSY